MVAAYVVAELAKEVPGLMSAMQVRYVAGTGGCSVLSRRIGLHVSRAGIHLGWMGGVSDWVVVRPSVGPHLVQGGWVPGAQGHSPLLPPSPPPSFR